MTPPAPGSRGAAGRSAGTALGSDTRSLDAKWGGVLAVVEDACQRFVTYPVTSPAGARVEPQPDGSVNFVSDIAGPPADQSGTYETSAKVTTINKPWAVDAAGKDLPTMHECCWLNSRRSSVSRRRWFRSASRLQMVLQASTSRCLTHRCSQRLKHTLPVWRASHLPLTLATSFA